MYWGRAQRFVAWFWIEFFWGLSFLEKWIEQIVEMGCPCKKIKEITDCFAWGKNLISSKKKFEATVQQEHRSHRQKKTFCTIIHIPTVDYDPH